MMKKKALIIGSGGHSRVVISIINEASLYDIVAIIDVSSKSSNDNSEFIKDIPVSNVSQLDEYYECGIDIAFIAIGDNDNREHWYKKLNKQFNLPNLISSSASIDKSSFMGNSNVICSNCFIGPDSNIGNNNILNTSSIIEHEVKIFNNCHIAPSATICGRSLIKSNCFIGANSTVIDKVSVAQSSTLGAGSTLLKSIDEENSTYVGSPAKKLSQI
tara:strand:- start:306 stop:953 length:648 start_codon:yes stop_codon:yes gene_type:complete